MKEYKMDFYSTTNLKSYDLNDSMRYQLAILDSLDVFTRVHSENVANLTCRICEYMHMKEYFIVYCTICAYLHDIGKQFIPPTILQKKDKLTDEEYEIIKTHTTIGYNMCIKDEKLRPYIAGPIYHHEGLDGSGYPKGISAEEIPLEGQIIRVADEFDAITSKRQYKSHIGVCDTLNILISETAPLKKDDSLGSSVAKFGSKSNTSKYGKINPKVVKALIKVVIDDTEYELYNLEQYINYLKEETKRLMQIEEYEEKMNKSKKDTDVAYYLAGMKELLARGETLENYKTVLEEYKQAIVTRKAEMDNLEEEFKKIKKLKV